MSDKEEEPYWRLMKAPRTLGELIQPNNVNNVHTLDVYNVHTLDEENIYNVHTLDEENVHNVHNVHEIHEIPYGGIKPTGYRSTLSDVDWMIEYLGFTWKKPYLEAICEEIDKRMSVLVGLGRDHGKTWTMMGKFTRYIIENAPKRCIVIASQAKYREIYEFVDTALEDPRIREDYGDLKKSSSVQNGIWFVDEYKPIMGANFLIKGSESFITGLHFEGIEDKDYYEDPNDIIHSLEELEEIGWLHLEDPVQEIRVGEAAERRVRRWIKRTLNYIRNHRVKFTVNFTRKDPEDIYQMLINEFRYPLFLILALEVIEGRLPTENEVTADHERGLLLDWDRSVGVYKTCECPNWPLPRLLYHFVFFRTDAEAELNNNPVNPEGSEFDDSDWKKALISPEEIEGGLDNVISFTFIDPSYGKGGSKTAILQVGVYYNWLLLLDAFVGHLGPTEYIEKVFEFKNKHNSEEIWIEDNVAQESRSLNAWNPMTGLRELRLFNTPSNQSKRFRIGLIGGQFRARVWRILKTIPFLEDIHQEYLTFDSKLDDTTIRQKFNALDIMQIAYEKKKRSLSTKRTPTRGNTKTRVAVSNSRRMFG